jgi:hypothetical protein
VLNQLFHYQEATIPTDFGTLITPADADAHLAKIRADREVWAKNNPNAVKLVQDLALPYQTIPFKNQYATNANPN